MRKFLVPSLVIVLALLIAMPAFALEVKWGGLFRARVISQADFTAYNYPGNDLSMIRWYTEVDPNTGAKVPSYYDKTTGKLVPWTQSATTGAWSRSYTDLKNAEPRESRSAERSISSTQHMNRFDQRLRMFIDFIASENLKVVTKMEANTVWGAYGSPGARNIVGGGNVGADNNNLGMKNAYLDFKIPNTPLTAKVGVQGIALIDSWIIDDDFSAALLEADLKPFKVTLGYVSGQNFQTTTEAENVDDLVAVVSYKEGPFSAAIMGLWQDAHNTPASIFPGNGPLGADTPVQYNINAAPYAYRDPWLTNLISPYASLSGIQVQKNQLFDLGVQLGYKMDYLSAYLNFVKNFGSAKLGFGTPGDLTAYTTSANEVSFNAANTTVNYKGWMIDAGANYFCGPWTMNLGGFYTSGDKVEMLNGVDGTRGSLYPSPAKTNIDAFTYPLATSKYFSEILGGGILDNVAPNGGYWSGYPTPSNIWTITAGAAWQALPQTKLSLSYWYFGTSEKVPSRYDNITGEWSMSNNLGSEIDLYITQNIVDKLNLDLVGAYLFTGKAYRPQTSGYDYQGPSNAYELGARLQWAW